MGYYRVRAAGGLGLSMVSTTVDPSKSTTGQPSPLSVGTGLRRFGTLRPSLSVRGGARDPGFAAKASQDPLPGLPFPIDNLGTENRNGLVFVGPTSKQMALQALHYMAHKAAGGTGTLWYGDAYVIAATPGSGLSAYDVVRDAADAGAVVLVKLSSVPTGTVRLAVAFDPADVMKMAAVSAPTDWAILEGDPGTMGQQVTPSGVDCAHPPPGICGPAPAMWSVEQCKCVTPQDKGGDQPAGGGGGATQVSAPSETPKWLLPVAIGAGALALVAVVVAARK